MRGLGLWATPLDPEYELDDGGAAVVHPAPGDVAAFLARAFPRVRGLRVVLPIDPGADGRDDASGWREVLGRLAERLDPAGLVR